LVFNKKEKLMPHGWSPDPHETDRFWVDFESARTGRKGPADDSTGKRVFADLPVAEAEVPAPAAPTAEEQAPTGPG
jgi:hypothetical protein